MIPFNKPYVTEAETRYLLDSIARNKISGDGYYTKKVSQYMEELFSTRKILLTTSCSSALDMSCLMADLCEGDEVILPSYTFVSTANCVALRGAKCVFADVDETLNIDIADVERKITSKTKMIIPVHYAGASCDMDRLLEVARKNNVMVVEDAAQAVNSKYKDRYLGTLGQMGCYSFHETKNYVCGEGGALLINTDDNRLVEKAEIIREKGTNRNKFFRGEVDKYSWVDIGSSFLPSDMLAAFLYAQFEKVDFINDKRRDVYNFYNTELAGLEEKGLIKRPIIPGYNKVNYHMFYILLNSMEERDALMAHMKNSDITAIFHYLPLHTSVMGKKMGYTDGYLPMTESISGRILRLPLYVELTREEQVYIVGKIKEWFKV